MLGRNSMRFFSWMLVLALAMLIPACGLVNTAYNNAPELMRWWLDDYFHFTSAQKATLTPALQRLHAWHREQQLPEYVLILKDLQAAMGNDTMNAEYTCEKIGQIKTSYGALQQVTVPIITEIAPQLTEKQMQYFRSKLEKRAQKWKDEWLQESPDEQVEARLDKIEDFAEKIYGPLDDAQLALLKREIKDSNVKPELTYAEILRRNEDVYQILNTIRKPDVETTQRAQLVKDGYARLRKSPNANYQHYADQMVKRSCEVIADLHASTTSQQKQHAYDYLESYIVQFSALSKKANSVTVKP
jgi:hypothetical protein